MATTLCVLRTGNFFKKCEGGGSDRGNVDRKPRPVGRAHKSLAQFRPNPRRLAMGRRGPQPEPAWLKQLKGARIRRKHTASGSGPPEISPALGYLARKPRLN